MLNHTLIAAVFVTCLGAGTAIAQGNSDQARPAKTDTDRAVPEGQDNRAPQADAREENRAEDNASDKSDDRRKLQNLEKRLPVETQPIDTPDAADPCPKPEDCI